MKFNDSIHYNGQRFHFQPAPFDREFRSFCPIFRLQIRGMPVTILGDKLNQNIALKTKIYLKYGNIYIKGDTLKKNIKSCRICIYL